MAKELSEKDLEAVELDDDLLEFVIGGMKGRQVGTYYYEELCPKCHHSFYLVDFGFEDLGYDGSYNRFILEHVNNCTGS